MAEDKGARLAVGFAEALRLEGVRVPLSSVIRLVEALDLVGIADRRLVYLAGRSCLVACYEELASYDRAFRRILSGDLAQRAVEKGLASSVLVGEEDGSRQASSSGAEDAAARSYSAYEALRQKDLALLTGEEREIVARVLRDLMARGERRASMRLLASHRGERLDLGATLRSSLSTGGEAVRRRYLSAGEKERRLVFLIDVSGSMEPYARAFVLFAQAAASTRRHGSVEAFALATRLTRITRELWSKDPGEALEKAASSAADWSGGTRLGSGLSSFNKRFGSRGVARGAIVVVCSDGWERGELELLGEEMRRLSLLARLVVWANPLGGSPGYEPTAAGMAVALPHVDRLVACGSLGELQGLVELIACGRAGARKTPCTAMVS